MAALVSPIRRCCASIIRNIQEVIAQPTQTPQ